MYYRQPPAAIVECSVSTEQSHSDDSESVEFFVDHDEDIHNDDVINLEESENAELFADDDELKISASDLKQLTECLGELIGEKLLDKIELDTYEELTASWLADGDHGFADDDNGPSLLNNPANSVNNIAPNTSNQSVINAVNNFTKSNNIYSDKLAENLTVDVNTWNAESFQFLSSPSSSSGCESDFSSSCGEEPFPYSDDAGLLDSNFDLFPEFNFDF